MSLCKESAGQRRLACDCLATESGLHPKSCNTISPPTPSSRNVRQQSPWAVFLPKMRAAPSPPTILPLNFLGKDCAGIGARTDTGTHAPWRTLTVETPMSAEQVQGDRKMTSVALYSGQPILTAGIEAVVAGLEDCTLSGVFTALDPFIEHIRTRRPSVALLDATAAVTFSILAELKLTAGDVPVVLWVDRASTGFVSQALATGVRGILRKSLPIELQIKCLRVVAAGDLWVEQTLCEDLLTARRVLLSRRERQLVGLLVEGHKNKEIAYAMTLSEGTVKVYLTRLFQKLGVSDRFELALLALKNCLVDAAREPQQAGADGKSCPEALPIAASFLPSFVRGERRAAAVTSGTHPSCMLC